MPLDTNPQALDQNPVVCACYTAASGLMRVSGGEWRSSYLILGPFQLVLLPGGSGVHLGILGLQMCDGASLLLRMPNVNVFDYSGAKCASTFLPQQTAF